MQINKTPEGLKISISSYRELIETIENNYSKWHKSSVNGDYSHTKTKSLQEAVDFLKNGTPENHQKLQNIESSLQFNKTLRVASFTMDTHGCAVDMGLFHEGIPECMFNPQFEEDYTNGRLLDIKINCAVTSNTSTQAIENRGIAFCGVINQLMSQGNKVGITIDKWIKYDGFINNTEIVLKQPQQPLAWDLLYFCLTHPSFNRRILFRIAELVGKQDFYTYFGAGYGHPVDNPTKSSWYLPALTNDNNFRSPEQAIAYMENWAKSQ